MKNRNMKNLVLIVLLVSTFYACKQVPNESKEEEVVVEKTEPKWVNLFDGKTFDGWHIYNAEGKINDEWNIENGVMFFNPKEGRTSGGKNLVTDKDFTNFKLSLEWKISKDGNSGIFWGVKEDAKYREAYETGPEIQVLDNSGQSDSNFGIGLHGAGALYDMVAPSKDVTKPVGEWNKYIIYVNHKTNEGAVWLNDEKIVEFPVNGEGWNEMVAKSKFKDWDGFGKFTTGKIGLQDHGNKVWFRNIKIQELD
jgi:3-keto-disaccharide hydrolase